MRASTRGAESVATAGGLSNAQIEQLKQAVALLALLTCAATAQADPCVVVGGTPNVAVTPDGCTSTLVAKVTTTDTSLCTLDPSTNFGVTTGTCANVGATATCAYVDGTFSDADGDGTLDTVDAPDSCTSTLVATVTPADTTNCDLVETPDFGVTEGSCIAADSSIATCVYTPGSYVSSPCAVTGMCVESLRVVELGTLVQSWQTQLSKYDYTCTATMAAAAAAQTYCDTVQGGTACADDVACDFDAETDTCTATTAASGAAQGACDSLLTTDSSGALCESSADCDFSEGDGSLIGPELTDACSDTTVTQAPDALTHACSLAADTAGGECHLLEQCGHLDYTCSCDPGFGGSTCATEALTLHTDASDEFVCSASWIRVQSTAAESLGEYIHIRLRRHDAEIDCSAAPTGAESDICVEGCTLVGAIAAEPLTSTCTATTAAAAAAQIHCDTQLVAGGTACADDVACDFVDADTDTCTATTAASAAAQGACDTLLTNDSSGALCESSADCDFALPGSTTAAALANCGSNVPASSALVVDEVATTAHDILLCGVSLGSYSVETGADDLCPTDLNPALSMGTVSVTASSGFEQTGEIQCDEQIIDFEACTVDPGSICAGSPCGNDGTCVVSCNEYTCACDQGFEGDACQFVAANDCEPDPCLNGARCEDGVQGFRCLCVNGFSGTTCETQEPVLYDPAERDCALPSIIVTVTPPTTEGFAASLQFSLSDAVGNLIISENGPDLGWQNGMCGHGRGYTRDYGPACSSELNEQYLRGLCGVTPGDFYTFQIWDQLPEVTSRREGEPSARHIYHSVPGYTSGLRGIPLMCMSEVAEYFSQGSWRVDVTNAAKNTTVVSGTHKIEYDSAERRCVQQTSFVVCEENPISCASSPCQNSGTCVDQCPGTFSCDCPDGYEGSLCETTTVDECTPSPCMNGGICSNENAGYVCSCQPGFTGTTCSEEAATVYDPITQTCPFPAVRIQVPVEGGADTGRLGLLNWELRYHNAKALPLAVAEHKLARFGANSPCIPMAGLGESRSCWFRGYMYVDWIGPNGMRATMEQMTFVDFEEGTWNYFCEGVNGPGGPGETADNPYLFGNKGCSKIWRAKLTHKHDDTREMRVDAGYADRSGTAWSALWYIAVDATDPSAPRTLPDLHADRGLHVQDGIAQGALVAEFEQWNGGAPPGVMEWWHPRPDMCAGPIPSTHDVCLAVLAPIDTTPPTCALDVSRHTCSHLEWTAAGDMCTDRDDGQCPTLRSFLDAVAHCATQGARMCTPSELGSALGTGCTAEVWSASRSTCANGEAVSVDGAGEQCRHTEENLGVRCCADVAEHCPVGSPCHSGTSLLSCAELGWDDPGGMTHYGNSHVCAEADDLDFEHTCSSNAPFDAAASSCLSAGARLCTLAEVLRGDTKFAGCFADTSYIWTASQTDPGNTHTPCNSGEVYVAKSNGAAQCEPMETGRALIVCCADRGDYCEPSTGNFHALSLETTSHLLTHPPYKKKGTQMLQDRISNHWSSLDSDATHLNIGVCRPDVGGYTFHIAKDQHMSPSCSDASFPYELDVRYDSHTTTTVRSETPFTYNNPTSHYCEDSVAFTVSECNMIDECASSPCLNGGGCSSGCLDYTCECQAGWLGENCGHADPCISDPCAAGMLCRGIAGLTNSDSWTAVCEVCRYDAVTQANVCSATCGNGVVDALEQCDDGNSNDGDGCSCPIIDDGFHCHQVPPDILLLGSDDVLIIASQHNEAADVPLAGTACAATPVCDGRWAVHFGQDAACSVDGDTTTVLVDIVQSDPLSTARELVSWTMVSAEDDIAVGDGPCGGNILDESTVLALVPSTLSVGPLLLPPNSAVPRCDGTWTVLYYNATESPTQRIVEAHFHLDATGSWTFIESLEDGDVTQAQSACVNFHDVATGAASSVTCEPIHGHFDPFSMTIGHHSKYRTTSFADGDGGGHSYPNEWLFFPVAVGSGMSLQACLAAVQSEHPAATGIELEVISTDSGGCYAIYGESTITWLGGNSDNWNSLRGYARSCKLVRTASSCPALAGDGGCTTSPSQCSAPIPKETAAMHTMLGALGVHATGDPCGTNRAGVGWSMVDCDGSAVRRLRLYDSVLQGTLSPAVANLSSLETVAFGSHGGGGAVTRAAITGTLPIQLYSMPSLKYFSVFPTAISGTIPSTVSCGPTLESMAFEYLMPRYHAKEVISGTLPDDWIGCENLLSIKLYNVRLSGTLPSGLSALTSLHTLNIMNAPDLGDKAGIPEGWVGLAQLRHLTIINSNTGGHIPMFLAQSAPLVERIYLRASFFSGTLPADTLISMPGSFNAAPGEWYPSQPRMEFSNNRISGTLPVSWRQLDLRQSPELRQMGSACVRCQVTGGPRLDYNEISGTIPAEWSEMGASEVWLSSNKLSGTLPANLLTNDARHSDLFQGIHVQNNMLEGSLPNEWAQLDQLETLEANSNRLTGQIPATWTAPVLQKLVLSSNLISGTVPVGLSDTTALQEVDLSFNPLPVSSHSAVALQVLSIKALQLTKLNCPFDATVNNADTYRDFKTKGPWAVVAGSSVTIEYSTAAEYGGAPLAAVITNVVTNEERELPIVDNGDGSYNLRVSNLTIVASWTVDVLLNGQLQTCGCTACCADLILAQVHVLPGPISPVTTALQVALPPSVTALSEMALIIVGRDEYGNSQQEGGDQFTASFGGLAARVVDVGDGTYETSFVPTVAEPLIVAIELFGVPVVDMPATTEVIATAASCALMQDEVYVAGETECICAAGYERGEQGTCTRCPSTKWSSQGQPCTVCPDPTTMVPSVNGDICVCADSYYNATADLVVCFDGGYDEEAVDNALAARDESVSTGQQCQPCPTDGLGRSCMDCRRGETPTVAAGFTTPDLPGVSTRRRLLGDEIRYAIACHEDLDIAVVRCPAASTGCLEGYSGYLCSSCTQDWGMMATKKCEPCELSGFSIGAALILIAIIAAVVLVVAGGLKIWEAFPAMHALRCSFQPLRIAVTYAQVTSQLGDVLNFNLPPVFASVIDALKPILDVWDLLFRALGSSECFGLVGFSARWWLRVVLLPAILMVIILVIFVVERFRGTSAYTHMRGNVFLAIFFCYPTICTVVFASFMCKAISPVNTVLASDDNTLCEDSDHALIQTLSVFVVILFSFGVPLYFGVMLMQKARDYEAETKGTNAALARRVSEDLKVDQTAAEYVIRDVIIGKDYSFIMDAYSPRYLYWEALDMVRKLFLVGLVLLVGRGSVAQLSCAILLSFAFFALQVKVNPYKIEEDNRYRSATEFHVFIVIVCAMVLEKTDISREAFTTASYDWVLFITWLILVPIGFVVTVVSKLRFVKRVLYGEQKGPRRAFNRCYVGLKNQDDVENFKHYLDGIRTQVQGDEFAKVLEGKSWKGERSSEQLELIPRSQAPQNVNSTQAPEASSAAPTRARVEDDQPETDTYYGKFEQGFTGTFADMQDYYGGLEKMIGECRKDILVAMEEEHCDVLDGFGASDVEFATSSYGVVTTPRQEWTFVVDPDQVGELSAGMDKETGRSRGFRDKLPIQYLLDHAAELITVSFKEQGFDLAITADQIRDLPLLREEIIALRLYTGPMFELYNGLLRAWGNADQPGYVPSYATVNAGLDVRNRYTTTLHVMNSGVLKLSRLQPATRVFRGISAMKLPKAFTDADEFNVRGGVEYGFMSTTTSEEVALGFAKGSNRETASTLVVGDMGMVDRGASLSWLSQYPHEREILLPPLTALEVKEIADNDEAGGFKVRRITVRLNCNLLSMTIEKLLSVRKKQVEELVQIVQRDIVKQNKSRHHPDLDDRLQRLASRNAAIVSEHSQTFNNNSQFGTTVNEVVGLMPKLGDSLEVRSSHDLDVYGLACTDTSSGFASSSWDGNAKLWSKGDDQTATCTTVALPAPSLAFVSLGPSTRVASGQFDGAIALQDLRATSTSAAAMLSTGNSPVTALCWSAGSGSGALDLTARVKGGTDDGPPSEATPPTRVTARITARRTGTPPRAGGSGDKPRAKARVVAKATKRSKGTATSKDLPTIEPHSFAQDEVPLLASGTMGGQIMLWNVEAQQPTDSVGGEAASQPGFGVSAGHSKSVRSLEWVCIDGKRLLVSASFDGSIIVWRVSSDTNKITQDRELQDTKCPHAPTKAHRGAVTVLCSVDTSGRRVASGSEDGSVKCWDLVTNEPPFTLLQQEAGGVCSLAWISRPYNNPAAYVDKRMPGYIACGTGINTIVIVDLESGGTQATLRGHSGAVHSLLWLESDGELVSGSSDTTVRIWRIQSDTL